MMQVSAKQRIAAAMAAIAVTLGTVQGLASQHGLARPGVVAAGPAGARMVCAPAPIPRLEPGEGSEAAAGSRG